MATIDIKNSDSRSISTLDNDSDPSIESAGLISRTFKKLSENDESWEPRPQQKVMADEIYRIMKSGGNIVIEAPTGIGKSLGYLVPTATAASVLSLKIVIASATLPLQDQISAKDIPALVKAFPLNFSWAVLKGRRNYLCLRRLQESANYGIVTSTADSKASTKIIEKWTTQLSAIINSPASDKDSLDFVPDDKVWKQLCCDPDRCSRQKCIHYRDCFLFKARKAAARADIIITNHDLLLADTVWKGDAEEGSALPAYDALIIDEAHKLEKTAMQHLSLRYGRGRAGRLRGDTEVILYSRIKAELPDDFVSPGFGSSRKKKKIDPRIKNIAHALDSNVEIHRHVFEEWDNVFRPYKGTGRLGTKAPSEEGISNIMSSLEAVEHEFRNFARSEPMFAREAQELAGRVQQQRMEWESFRPENRTDDKVYWYENGERGIAFIRSPISAGPDLNRMLFSQTRSTICTSATLSVNGCMEYFRDSCGLSECEELVLDSPFDFSRQAALIVPDNLNNPDHGSFLEEGGKAIQDILTVTSGRAFVLFTSFSMLDAFYNELSKPLSLRGMNVLKQGDMPRSMMINTFRSSEAPVLFGTNSFWEGVDIKGSNLSCVIIMRLPFEQPNNPLLVARCDQVKEQGKNPFKAITVPQATLRLKQGVGRLIRSSNDRGIVMIMDVRIDRSSYGHIIKSSLPSFRRIKLQEAESFMADTLSSAPVNNKNSKSEYSRKNSKNWRR